MSTKYTIIPQESLGKILNTLTNHSSVPMHVVNDLTEAISALAADFGVQPAEIMVGELRSGPNVPSKYSIVLPDKSREGNGKWTTPALAVASSYEPMSKGVGFKNKPEESLPPSYKNTDKYSTDPRDVFDHLKDKTEEEMKDVLRKV